MACRGIVDRIGERCAPHLTHVGLNERHIRIHCEDCRGHVRPKLSDERTTCSGVFNPVEAGKQLARREDYGVDYYKGCFWDE